VKTFGTMADVPFDTSASPDLVLLGYRRSELPPTA